MATNLRLRAEAENALRREAARTGRSQQELIRTAIDEFLGLGESGQRSRDEEQLRAAGAIASRTPYARPASRLVLPANLSTADLLDRDDRI